MYDSAHGWWRDDVVLQRFVCDLLAAELSALRPTSLIAQPSSWTLELDLVRDLAVDSLELVALATALNEALHLYESGLEDRLLVRHTIRDWLAVARDSLELFSAAMTFRTSGSSGVPKRCAHSLDSLWQEVRELVPLFADRRRVLSAVRSHHIYGFLWTALLPRAPRETPADVIDLRGRLPASLSTVACEGDLVIGYPDFWRMVVAAGASLPQGIIAMTSTAPCPDDVAKGLRRLGIHTLVQIYGSSETGGVGVRTMPGMPYTLLSFWQRGVGDAEIVRTSPNGTKTAQSPQDILEWQDDRHFRPTARIDDAIQVAGVNVFPSLVRRVLMEHPAVADAAVRPMGEGAANRLKAFLVPHADAPDNAVLRAELEALVTSRLSAPERPRAMTFGDAIPVDGTGKLADWHVG